jgi:hypothetical protein
LLIRTLDHETSAFAPTQGSASTKGWTTMGFFSKDIKNMDDLFVHTLRDMKRAKQMVVTNRQV